ncbi:DEAD/DEAH box helicase [Pediococcus claussenii]|uniref:DEAD/DEAH box helicase family protein n=1 Tax=Pediococcus claussenii (strain ATCC BAA-344 / DSM 14800 / JCM 18046 / KCTC 3811 / LMG 21948 / P06) TaxID=701521 RepID=G8PDZ1_PEDCP|nr:DEAD/DEAH box helicase [Pediococcus claussenii]AEV95476.1 DEAD/DEAH box helicase family protein [Pediococcus claussenii ATCC BAA-344]ANZ69001.1 helicase [Pediococcus claussenii]ANZ70817.1 helicase [Pediococcus claussenii]KRN20287.1 hypothetical protein IV79_GL000956 [Pediococcus claussenii]
MNDIFKQHFTEKGFEQQTLIQKRVEQKLRDGESVIGLSPTGSGKTVAFVLPLLEKIIPGNGTQLLIIAPSQELAIQTTEVVREWGTLIKLKVTSVTGGANMQRQIERLKTKPEIVVGTPGRIKTMIDEKRLKVSEISALVIDEADQLLTGDTLVDIQAIEDNLQSDLQFGFFSATMNQTFLEDLNEWFNIDPEVVDVREEDDTRGDVTHGWFAANDLNSKVRWLRTLQRIKKFQALVFFNHVSSLEKVNSMLKHEGVSVGKIAGHQVQTDRASMLRKFRKGELKYLMVTDVAARGLDIEDLPAVINFDIPQNITTYTHRMGRTGRMGKSGFVLSFGNDHDIRDLRKIVQKLNLSFSRMMVDEKQIVPFEKKVIDRNSVNKEKEITTKTKTPSTKVGKANNQNKSQNKIVNKPETPVRGKKGKKKHSKRMGLRHKRNLKDS